MNCGGLVYDPQYDKDPTAKAPAVEWIGQRVESHVLRSDEGDLFRVLEFQVQQNQIMYFSCLFPKLNKLAAVSHDRKFTINNMCNYPQTFYFFSSQTNKNGHISGVSV